MLSVDTPLPSVPRLTLSIEETARALGVGLDHVYAAVRGGRLPHVRFGARVVVPVTALERWLHEEATRQAQETAAAAVVAPPSEPFRGARVGAVPRHHRATLPTRLGVGTGGRRS